MHAAYLAYTSGKCAKFIVSGDNRHHDYNEPDMMKDSLSKLGIPTENIYCDYAGGRTLDSVIRFKMVFGQSSGIVISQQFHNARAIYIGKSHNISLIGLNAEDPTAFSSFKTKFREVFSRTRAFLMLNSSILSLGIMVIKLTFRVFNSVRYKIPVKF